VVISDVTPAADGVYTYDLPVNACAYVDLVIKCLNVTDEATLANVLALVTKIEVLNRGESVVSLSAADLYALDTVLLRGVPVFSNLVATDNATRWVGLRIPFGRKVMDPDECYPSTRKGEFQLQLTVDIATAEADGLILLAEAMELIGATPSRHLKCTTLTKTPAATGDADVDLPIGNELGGILLFSTTVPTSTAWTTTVDKVKLLADNVEKGYAQANWEAVHADLVARGGMPLGAEDAWADDAVSLYGYMDFSPGDGDEFVLETSGLASLTLRVTAGDTNVLRVLPVELVGVGG